MRKKAELASAKAQTQRTVPICNTQQRSMSSGLPLCVAEQDVVCRKRDCKTTIASFPALVIPDLWEMMHGSGRSMAITVPTLVF